MLHMSGCKKSDFLIRFLHAILIFSNVCYTEQKWWKGCLMSVDEIIEQVTEICKKNQVEHLSLFGSYAKGTQTPYSDLDFIVYGAVDMDRLQEQVDEIMTLKKIDLFEYDLCQNEYLREDMDRYGKKIY